MFGVTAAMAHDVHRALAWFNLAKGHPLDINQVTALAVDRFSCSRCQAAPGQGCVTRQWGLFKTRSKLRVHPERLTKVYLTCSNARG